MHAPHDMTWYERTIKDNKAVYTRHVVPMVSWQERKAANVIKAGLLEADKATIYVPCFLGGVDRGLNFPFKIGDMLVKGVVQDEITADFSIEDLVRKYPYSVKVTSVDYKDYPLNPKMSHIQIGGM
jgi:hypothetical protein